MNKAGKLPGLDLPPFIPRDEDAQKLAEKVVRRVVRDLQRRKDRSMRLSGDDSPLKNAWDEVCVRRQLWSSSGVHWAHKASMEATLTLLRDALDERARLTLWILTEDGWSWHYDVTHGIEPDEEPDFITNDLVEMLVGKVLEYADNYRNTRITHYLEREDW